MPEETETPLEDYKPSISRFDALFFIQKMGKKQQFLDAVTSGFVDPDGHPDVLGPSEGIDYDASIEKIAQQLSFNTAFDDFDFYDLIDKALINPAVALEEMQLLADFSTQPRAVVEAPARVNTSDTDGGDFLAFSSFDDIIV